MRRSRRRAACVAAPSASHRACERTGKDGRQKRGRMAAERGGRPGERACRDVGHTGAAVVDGLTYAETVMDGVTAITLREHRVGRGREKALELRISAEEPINLDALARVDHDDAAAAALRLAGPHSRPFRSQVGAAAIEVEQVWWILEHVLFVMRLHGQRDRGITER